MDMLHGAELISTTIKTLRDRRNEECFKNLLEESSKFASKVGIEGVLEIPRSRRRKVMPGEVSLDDAITDPEKKFRINLFYAVYDTCLLQIEMTFFFDDFPLITKRFAVLLPTHFEDAESCLSQLAVLYSVHINPLHTIFIEECTMIPGNILLVLRVL